MGLVRCAWRQVTFRLARNLLTLAGLAAGMGLVVAVSLANRAVAQAFNGLVERVGGRAVLQVRGGETGFPEEILTAVREQPGVRHAAPLILGTVFIDDARGSALAIVGVDALEDRESRMFSVEPSTDMPVEDPILFLSSPESVLVTEAFARDLGLSVDEQLPVMTSLGRKRLVVRGTVRPQGAARLLGERVAIMDVFAAQLLFGKKGKFDRISISIDNDARADDVARSLARRLPANLAVERPEHQQAEMGRRVAAFRYSVALVGIVTLLLGLLMVHATMRTAVLSRRQELGILRAVGARRSDVLRLIVGEAAIVGIGAALIGLFAGALGARLLVSSVGAAAERQFLVALDMPSVPTLAAAEVLQMLAAVIATVVAAWWPARAAGRVPVLVAMRREMATATGTTRHGRLAGAGIAMATAGAILLAVGAQRQGSVEIGIATALLILGFLLLSGVGAAAIAARSEPMLRLVDGVRGSLASHGLTRYRDRVAFTASVLAVGVLLHTLLATIRHSVRTTIISETTRAVGADLIVYPAFLIGGRLAAPVDGGVAEELRALPGIAQVVSERRIHQSFRDDEVLLVAYDEPYFEDSHYGMPTFVSGDPVRALHAVAEEGAILVTENFAFRFNVGVGDDLTFDTIGGRARTRVVGVVAASIDDRGAVLLSRRTYLRWWRDPLVSTFHLTLTTGADAKVVKDRILSGFGGDYRFRVLDGPELRAHFARNVDEAFSFARGLETVVLLVVLLSLADTLLVSVLGRTREIGVLRALGARRRDVVRMVTLESLAIAGPSALIGIAGGALLGVAWMRVHFRYLFGWMMPVALPFTAMFLVPLAVAAAASLAAAYPGRRASRLSISASLVHE